MKKLFLLFILMVMTLPLMADATKINGIYYLLDSSTKTAAVTYHHTETSQYTEKYIGVIEIPSEIIYMDVTYSVTSIGESAFENCSSLTSITIPNSITSIGKYAFRGCSRLTSITIPNSITSIDKGAFTNTAWFNNMEDGMIYVGSVAYQYKGTMQENTSITIKDGTASIGQFAFYGCSGMTSVTIPNSVTSIGQSAFYGCNGMTSVTIPNSVTSIGQSAFAECSSLTSVKIEDGEGILEFKTSSAYMPFSSCPLETLYMGRNICYSKDSSPFKGLKELSSLTIGNSVTSIGGAAFQYCSGLTSVDIPNSVTSIGASAFRGCHGLTSVNIGNSVTSIGGAAFQYCSGLTSVDIPNSVTSIGQSAFAECSSLTSVKIEDGEGTLAFNTSSAYMPFSSCPLETLYMGRNICYSKDSSPFKKMKDLSSLTLGNQVTSIEDDAFFECSGLTSVTIPNSVTRIGESAFHKCSGLTSLTIPNNVTIIGASAFRGCHGLTSVNIGNSVASIGGAAFQYCSGLTSVDIPNSVTSIGQSAFAECSSLTSVKIEDGEGTLAFNTSYDSTPFSSCPLETLYMGRNISYSKDSSPFRWNHTLSSLTIGNSVTSIGDYAFLGCSGLTSVSIPESVTSIGDYAFSGCSSLKSVSMSDNIFFIGNNTFVSDCKLYVKKGSKTLLTLWNTRNNDGSLVYKLYEKITDKEIMPPSFNITATQTTAKVEIENWSDGYTYTYNGVETTEKEFVYTKMKPASTHDLTLAVSKDDVQHVVTGSFTTKGLSPRIQFTSTASSISATGEYTEEDAKVISHSIQIGDGEAVKGNKCFESSLTPNKSYMVKYTIEVDYGGEEAAVYTGTSSAWTANLKFDNAQPKVVSEGNIIVSSTCSNLDPAETTMGFEWRCTDWTDEFPSNRGSAFLYDGVLEGMIKNLNVNKLWKFRPYYVSASGNYTYGDWTGIDPTNTSYFEPTVRTYSKVSIEGNAAEVSGYTLKGTDEVTTTGFKYWKSKSGVSQRSAVAIPSDAITVITTGQQTMSAKLTKLAYNAEYTYVAFATTADGSTYYGAEQSFITGEDPNSTDIESIEIEPSSTSTGEPVTIVARYNMNGQQISTPQKGVNILRYSDGSSKKVQVK